MTASWVTDVNIGWKRASVCGYTAMLARSAFSLSVGSGARVFVAKSDPFSALQACMSASRWQRHATKYWRGLIC